MTRFRFLEALLTTNCSVAPFFVVGPYEIRYEIRQSTIYVLRLWHTREDR